MREDQVSNGVTFLTHPKVQQAPLEERLSFLRNKGLTEEEIEEAVRRANEGTKDEKAVAPKPDGENGDKNPTQQMMYPNPPPGYTPPTPADPEKSWFQRYVVPGTLALSTGAGLTFLYKTMVLKQGQQWPQQLQQWWGPYGTAPPPGVPPPNGPMLPQQQQQQQQQPQQLPHEQQPHASLPGAPGAVEALASQGKSIPSAERYYEQSKGQKSEGLGSALVPLDQGTMFGQAPYAPAGTLGSSGLYENAQGASELAGIVNQQSEILKEVGNTLKSLTTQLNDIKNTSTSSSTSTSKGSDAWAASLAQSTSDIKAELSSIKTLLLSGQFKGDASALVNHLQQIESKMENVESEVSGEEKKAPAPKNPIDDLIKAASKRSDETSSIASESTAKEEVKPEPEEPEKPSPEQIAEEKMHECRTVLAKMVQDCPKDKIRGAVNLLLMYFRNLAKAPEVPRYGRIARANASYTKSLGDVKHHIEFLKANGFEEKSGFGSASRSPTLEWAEEWRENKDGWALKVLNDSIANLETVLKNASTSNDSTTEEKSSSSSSSSTATGAKAASSEKLTSSPVQKTVKKPFVAPPFQIPAASNEAPKEEEQPEFDIPGAPVMSVASKPVQSGSENTAQNEEQQADAQEDEQVVRASFSEIMKMHQEGVKLPGIKKIPNTLSADADAPSKPSAVAPPKPWEAAKPKDDEVQEYYTPSLVNGDDDEEDEVDGQEKKEQPTFADLLKQDVAQQQQQQHQQGVEIEEVPMA